MALRNSFRAWPRRRTFYANNGWLQRPGLWPGAEAVTHCGSCVFQIRWDCVTVAEHSMRGGKSKKHSMRMSVDLPAPGQELWRLPLALKFLMTRCVRPTPPWLWPRRGTTCWVQEQSSSSVSTLCQLELVSTAFVEFKLAVTTSDKSHGHLFKWLLKKNGSLADCGSDLGSELTSSYLRQKSSWVCLSTLLFKFTMYLSSSSLNLH